MKQKQFNSSTALRFTHFSRKGYALFSVLGREVLVGVLAVSTLTYAKAEGISTDTYEAQDSLQRQEVKLDEVIVTGTRAPLSAMQMAKVVTVVTRDDIARASAASINDVLKLATGVDVRQRGGFGVQTDISLRGGNFDQITILLNGVNISSPHTGHLSADFPVSPDDIQRIEVLEGGYENGLCGVINIITTENNAKGLHAVLNLSGGSYGYATGNSNISHSSNIGCNGTLRNSLAFGYSRSDGATPNSAFNNTRIFYNGCMSLGNTEVSAQLGYSYKPYEANTFYGASSTDQWESNERFIASVNAKGTIGAGFGGWEGLLYYNKWYDHYQWHRYNPAGENYHDVDAFGATANVWFKSILGKTSVGGEMRGENIWSTKLGLLQDERKWRDTHGHDANSEIKYKYHDDRTIYKAYIEHNVLLHNITISPALTYMKVGSINSLLPAVNMRYNPIKRLTFFASWNKALRMPTFTDLYYSGANIEGNKNLKPEKTNDLQFCVRHYGRGYKADVQLFYSHKSDMIDWATIADASGLTDGIFHSINFRMNNLGAELNTSFLPRELWGEQFPLRQISAQYCHISENSDYGASIIQSKYAMDYLRNKIVLAADGRIWKNLNMSISWRWCDRVGSGNEPYSILDTHISWDSRNYSIYVDGTNILNKQYYDYISIPQPGIVVIGGIKIKL